MTATLLDLADADSSYTDGTSLVPLLTGKSPTRHEPSGTVLAEYEGHGVTTVGRMIRRANFKLNYYHGQRSELFDLDSDPDEFNDLIDDPGYASIAQELTDEVTADWDGQKIFDSVVSSQKQRLITARGSSGYWSPPWRGGEYG